MPKISVIVPIYGVEQYIERCAESLFSQTLPDVEYLFIDDCSQDRSIEKLTDVINKKQLRFAEMKWDIRIVEMPTNSGLPAVRRRGIQLAKGDYIIHCDSDDWMEPEMLKLLYDKAIEENADIVVCDYFVADNQGKRIKTGCIHTDTSQMIKDCCYYKTPWSVWNKLVKSVLYNESFVYPKGNMGEDMVLTTQVLLESDRITYVDIPLYNYYNNTTSITKKVSESSLVAKYQQFRDNVGIVISLFEDKKYGNEFDGCIISLKWMTRKQLWGLVHDKKYYILWKETFPAIDRLIMRTPVISVADKIRYILTLLKIYPFKYISGH